MKKTSRWSIWKKALQMELREHKSSFTVYVVMRALIILMMIRPSILYHLSGVGYHAAYAEWIFDGGDWIRAG